MVRVDLFTKRSPLIRVEKGRAMVPSPGVAAFTGFAAQAKLVCLVRERRSVRSSPTLPFGFNPCDVTGTEGIDI